MFMRKFGNDSFVPSVPLEENPGMNLITELRGLFRGQLILRGALASTSTVLLVLALGLITADEASWWFNLIPAFGSVSTWLKAQNPWNLFLFMFIGVNLITYTQQVQGVLLDRYNAKVLIQQSMNELNSSADPLAEISKRRALLGARRRLLESILKFDPFVWRLVALAIALSVLGHWWAGVFLLVEGVLIFILLPRMISGFEQIRARQQESSEAENSDSAPLEQSQPAQLSADERKILRQRMQDPEERAKIGRLKAQQNLNGSAQKMMTLVNRPLIRLRVGWPAIALAGLTVAGVTVTTIADMSSRGELPERSTLLILLLVLTSNIALRLAQSSEDLAFFASTLEEISESEDGSETL